MIFMVTDMIARYSLSPQPCLLPSKCTNCEISVELTSRCSHRLSVLMYAQHRVNWYFLVCLVCAVRPSDPPVKYYPCYCLIGLYFILCWHQFRLETWADDKYALSLTAVDCVMSTLLSTVHVLGMLFLWSEGICRTVSFSLPLVTLSLLIIAQDHLRTWEPVYCFTYCQGSSFVSSNGV